MVDPLFTPALVGVVLAQSIDLAKNLTMDMIYCKKYKKQLLEKLQFLGDFVREMEDELDKAKEDEVNFAKRWIEKLKKVISEGNDVIGQCSKIPCAPWSRILLSQQIKSLLHQLTDLASQATQVCCLATQRVANAIAIGEVSRTPVAPSNTNNRTAKLPNLVGRENDLKKLLQLLLDVQAGPWVGIHGLAGCGKSALARELENHETVRAHFAGNLFFIDASQSETLTAVQLIVQLQEMLYKDVIGKQEKFSRKSEGKDKLYNLLKDQKCFLIIDNVWEFDVLTFLDVVNSENGSKILVTTRNSNLLDKCHAKKVLIRTLCSDDSWSLFCKHAFGVESPKDKKLEKAARELAGHCGGLPLALKALGISMAGKEDIQVWERALKELRKANPINKEHETDFYKCLKLSYDELSSADDQYQIQECFLDLVLARYYSLPEIVVRWEVLRLINSDEGSEQTARHILDILAKRSFIPDYDFNDKSHPMVMHGSTRALAAYIMKNERPRQSFDMMNASLTEFPINVLDMQFVKKIQLDGNELDSMPIPSISAPKLELLVLQDNPFKSSIPEASFEGFPNLKLLDLDRVHVEVSMKSLRPLHKLEILYLSRDYDTDGADAYFACKHDANECFHPMENLRNVSLECYCPSFLCRSTSLLEAYLDVSYQCFLHLAKTINSLTKLKILTLTIQKRVRLGGDERGRPGGGGHDEEDVEGEREDLLEGMKLENLKTFGLHLGEVSGAQKTYISRLNWQAFPELENLSISNMDWTHVKFKYCSELKQLEIHDFQFWGRVNPRYMGLNRAFCFKTEFGKACSNLTKLPGDVAELQHLEILNIAMCPMISEVACEQDHFSALQTLIKFKGLHSWNILLNESYQRMTVLKRPATLASYSNHRCCRRRQHQGSYSIKK